MIKLCLWIIYRFYHFPFNPGTLIPSCDKESSGTFSSLKIHSLRKKCNLDPSKTYVKHPLLYGIWKLAPPSLSLLKHWVSLTEIIISDLYHRLNLALEIVLPSCDIIHRGYLYVRILCPQEPPPPHDQSYNYYVSILVRIISILTLVVIYEEKYDFSSECF